VGGIILRVAVTKLQTQNILSSDGKLSSCAGRNKIPDHDSVIAHKALTLADRSQEKLL
jgi:hypothetical protein